VISPSASANFFKKGKLVKGGGGGKERKKEFFIFFSAILSEEGGEEGGAKCHPLKRGRMACLYFHF